ncbi:hypothetical protein, partial [Hydrogenophaga sp.]|uniref:hypothetical protein n=1 Tax=Hydrogenophaga sp. TaxID=1904254 RepID=UPI0035637E98
MKPTIFFAMVHSNEFKRLPIKMTAASSCIRPESKPKTASGRPGRFSLRGPHARTAQKFSGLLDLAELQLD